MSLTNLIYFLEDNDIDPDTVELIAGYKEVRAWFPELDNLRIPEADENGVIDVETGIEEEDSTGDNFIQSYFDKKYGLYISLEYGISV